MILARKIAVAGAAIVLSLSFASAASALTASCAGVPSTTSIAWTASSVGGIDPVAFLWGNGSASSTQTLTVSPGFYSMTLQATDASSTVATTTCGATVVAAATTTATTTPPVGSLASQIQALLNQINALKAQILLLVQQSHSGGGTATTTPGTLPGTCFDFKRDLRSGHRGDDVKELQRMLASDPSLFPPGLITGFFGKKTEEALKKFQRKIGIFSVGTTTTGFFGPRSRGFFKEHCRSHGMSNSSSTSPRLDDRGRDDRDNRGNRGRDGRGDSDDD